MTWRGSGLGAWFEKTNVSSRQELVARIFLDDYLPQIAAGTPINGAGGFAAA
jgi:hypothetical protein